ncbi:MAG TPA: hypothetical protein VI316_11955 [Candidatus Dormibacteraeota bacterium]
MSMAVGPGALKLAAGLGTAAVIGVSAAVVAADAKPAGAPLKPPVNGVSAAAAQPNELASAGTLSIPVTPVCQRSASGSGVAAAAATARPTTAAAAALDPAVAAALQQLKTATTAQQRQAVMAALTPDQRMQVTAYVAAHRASRNPNPSAPKGSCRGVSSTGATGSSTVAPSVVDAGPAAPLAVSAVS